MEKRQSNGNLSPALSQGEGGGNKEMDASRESLPPLRGGSGRGFLFELNGVVVHSDILTEYFCCDIEVCHGACCEQGDAGAPVTLEEIGEIEDSLDAIWPQMSASAQAVIDKQGVAYTDPEGELVTSIVCGRDCAFRGPQGCLLPKRPISCFLYPIREKKLGSLVGIDYHRWNICQAAIEKGKREGIHVYQFLKEPLIRRFGEAWYKELEIVAKEIQEIPISN